MKTLQELEKQLANIQKEVEAIKQGKPEPVKYEVGKVYKSTMHPKLLFMITLIDKRGYAYGYGFCQSGDFVIEDKPNGFSCMCNDTSLTHCIPATTEEWKSALEAEAVKRGFKNGVEGIAPDIYIKEIGDVYDEIVKNGWLYNPSIDTLFAAKEGYGGLPVYSKGQWATIIKEQPLMIGGYEVKLDKQRCFEFEINGQSYSVAEIEILKAIMDRGQVKSLNVGCNSQHLVDLDFINKMLALK